MEARFGFVKVVCSQGQARKVLFVWQVELLMNWVP